MNQKKIRKFSRGFHCNNILTVVVSRSLCIHPPFQPAVFLYECTGEETNWRYVAVSGCGHSRWCVLSSAKHGSASAGASRDSGDTDNVTVQNWSGRSGRDYNEAAVRNFLGRDEEMYRTDGEFGASAGYRSEHILHAGLLR